MGKLISHTNVTSQVDERVGCKFELYTAIENADIALMQDDLSKVAEAVELVSAQSA